MSSFAWMKVLESVPERYDEGVDMLSRGRIAEVYDAIAELAARPGRRVLDIGCGTGAVSLRCAERGAEVVGIDVAAGMLEVARQKTVPAEGGVEWLEIGVAEMEDHFSPTSFGAIVSCLAFSELSPDEQRYALAAARRLLEPGGDLVIADEIEPAAPLPRLWRRLERLPRIVATYALTQTTTRPVHELGDLVRAAGFADVTEKKIWSETFVIVHARAPGGSP